MGLVDNGQGWPQWQCHYCHKLLLWRQLARTGICPLCGSYQKGILQELARLARHRRDQLRRDAAAGSPLLGSHGEDSAGESTDPGQ